jgi:peptidoglycan/xylan/chitin deacetylase (PgdA/CDA1 family)
LFLIDKDGWLQTDDYSISDYTPVGFSRPLVTLTFDDGQEDNVSTALPVMNGYGFKSTQCFATDHIEGDQAQVNRILQFRNSGHEICSHTVNHPFLTSLSAIDRNYELRHAQQYLQSITGAPIKNFASPYGDYNTAVMNNIAQYYRSHRTVDEGYNSKDNFNIYRLRVQNMLSTTTVAELNSWFAQAKSDNTWLILVYHRIGDDPGPYDNTLAQFQQQMAALKTSGLSVKTYDDALNELVPQL